MGQRRRARECALQMLYQIDQTGGEPQDVFATFWNGELQVAPELRAFAESLVLGVLERRDEMDPLIAACARNWRLERMAVVDRNVLRLAAYELIHDPDTPPAVIIDEAIEISGKFGSADSGKFINGVLDAIRDRVARGRGES